MIQSHYSAQESSIVIVGGESSIGKQLTDMLLSAQCIVYSIDIHEQSERTVSDHFHYFQAYPKDKSQLKGIGEQLESNKITGLVCLSGSISHFGQTIELEEEQWQEVFDISFKSCYNACKVFAPSLAKSQQASIVNMSSGLAFGGQANYGPYTNAKAAINALTKTLATELAPRIRVNSIAPGAVDTPFIYSDGKLRFDLESYLNIVPLKSLAKPKEIADLILFLLSTSASHITGQCIHVNGGAMMR